MTHPDILRMESTGLTPWEKEYYRDDEDFSDWMDGRLTEEERRAEYTDEDDE